MYPMNEMNGYLVIFNPQITSINPVYKKWESNISLKFIEGGHGAELFKTEQEAKAKYDEVVKHVIGVFKTSYLSDRILKNDPDISFFNYYVLVVKLNDTDISKKEFIKPNYNTVPHNLETVHAMYITYNTAKPVDISKNFSINKLAAIKKAIKK